MLPEDIQARLETAFTWLDERTFGIPSILRQLLEQFNRERAAEAAASISYYALFSLFPLLLTLVSVVGFVASSEEAQSQAIQLFLSIIPVSRDFIRQNLNELIDSRTSVGIIGFVGLIWAASGVFLTLTRNINRAWANSQILNIFQSRAIALAIIAGLSLLLVLAGVWTTFSRLLAALNVPLFGGTDMYQTPAWRLISLGVPWVGSFLVLALMYRYVPVTRVRWKEALWGALTATVLWQLLNAVLSWYLASGLVTWELIYGSLSTLIAFMLWIYLSALVALIGAHLSSAIACMTRPADFADKRKSPIEKAQ
ncbi:MAG TPA: YihY/virulence factor BrkB family protein [Anaerolineales bacterium]|nr:YihY/virulence factor BrkB family protein [Anaerolineales bacterium]